VRAAQPLRAAVRAHFAANYESFAGYRNLQGMFIERAASLLRPGGRLGFIVASSMSELAGYAPTRAAHDRLCHGDAPLRDLGAEEFPGVFQPSMALVSTRRASRRESPPEGSWPLDEDLRDAAGRALLSKLSEPPPL